MLGLQLGLALIGKTTGALASWILATGSWNDGGTWFDSASWRDV